MGIVHLLVEIKCFYTSFRYYRKWINVEYWGSVYPDFREYEIIGKQKLRQNGKLMWPQTNYTNIKCIDIKCIEAGAA